jgi:methylthioribose-1-phosphate isomerase
MNEAEPDAERATDAGAPQAPEPGGEPGAPAAAPVPNVDLGRRRFFRQFATEVFQTAATVAGAATALQRTTAEAAGAILNPDAATVAPVVDEAPPAQPELLGRPGGLQRAGARGAAAGAAPTGYRSAFRIDDGVLLLIDQRRLPAELAVVEVRSAVELAHELREWTIGPGPAAGQAAAVAMGLTANKSRGAKPYGRRAILRAGATQLRSARPTSRYVIAAVERAMAAYEAAGEFSEDGDAIAGALWAEADAILSEGVDDLARIGQVGLLQLPRGEGPVEVLVRGAIGPLAGGQVGTVMAILRAAQDAGRELIVHVAETRPSLLGARVTAWELEQAGIAHTLVTDGAAGWLLEAGRAAVVFVGAERIAANGDVAADVGTYPLAVVAARHGVPFVVCAPLAAVDFDVATGRELPVEQGPATAVTRIGTVALAHPEAAVLNPITDVTPNDLVAAIVTEEGAIRSPYDRSILGAWHARTVRHGMPRTGVPPSMRPAPPEPDPPPESRPEGTPEREPAPEASEAAR